MVEQQPTSEEIEFASARRAAFVASIPKAVLEAEDKLPGVVAGLNASTRSKLQRIYLVADELSKVREPFVACGKGCNSCCHMNVSITSVEAERLGKAVGRRPAAQMSRMPRRAKDHFVGQPCPFLDAGGACSVHADRPLVCRKHASFFKDATACRTEVINEIQVPRVTFSGLDQALFDVSTERGTVILADIRGFFPSAN